MKMIPLFKVLYGGYLFATILPLIGAADDTREIRLGLLTPWQTSFEGVSGLTSAAAVSIAIEYVNQSPDFTRFELR